MKKFFHILTPVLFASAIGGCKKYVDIKTQGTLVPGETINYRYILNDNNNFEGTVRCLDLLGDDIKLADSTQMAQLAGSVSYQYYYNAYTWQNVIYANTGDQDTDWDRLYKIIYNMNVVISETPGSTGGTEAEKNQLIAEAKVHRADAYLTLINLYAKPYNPSTAATDPGVPLMTAPTVTEALIRNPVADVYKQILSDLTTAYPSLPLSNSYNFLPTRQAAFAELARTNLYMGNHAAAGAWADSALAKQSTLNNLAALTLTTYPKRFSDPEVLLSKQAYQSHTYMPIALRVSDTVLSLLGTNDLRYTFFTIGSSYFGSAYTGRFFYKEILAGYETRNLGPSVPEMMLIKAEALARSGDATGAMTMVNNLRQKRFTTANYVALAATSASDALVKVIQERQREFFSRGLRWFDMRRLKNEAPFSYTLTRKFNGVTYTLEPNSNRYVYPIADYYRQFNPGITANP